MVQGAKAVDGGLQDRLEVAGFAVDRRDGDDHVENLLEREVVADFVGLLCGAEEQLAGDDHTVAVPG